MDRELQQVVLDTLQSTGGLQAFLDGSIRDQIKDRIGEVRQREHRAAVMRRRDERRDDMRRLAAKANLVWQTKARVARNRRAVVLELRRSNLLKPLPEHELDLVERSSGEPGPLAIHVRRQLVQRRAKNKCRVCGEVMALERFAHGSQKYPATRCLKCSRAGRDPLQLLLNRQCSESKSRAKKRGSAHDITGDFLVNLYEEQDGACVLCGGPMSFIQTDQRTEQTNQWLSGVPTNVSVDQIEPGAGYTEANVQLVHLECNLAKRDANQEDFILLCNRIAARHPRN